MCFRVNPKRSESGSDHAGCSWWNCVAIPGIGKGRPSAELAIAKGSLQNLVTLSQFALATISRFLAGPLYNSILPVIVTGLPASDRRNSSPCHGGDVLCRAALQQVVADSEGLWLGRVGEARRRRPRDPLQPHAGGARQTARADRRHLAQGVEQVSGPRQAGGRSGKGSFRFFS